MNIIERYDKQFSYSSVIINIFMIYQYFTLWLNPSISDTNKIYTIVILIAFEFIMVHSGLFMSVFPKKISLYLMVPIYGLFALAFNSFITGNYILYLYLFVVFKRMRFALSDVSTVLKIRAIKASIMYTLSYFFLIIVIVIFSDSIPVFGLTREFLNSTNYYQLMEATGLFTEMPHIAISLAIAYYVSLVLIDIYLINFITNEKIENSKLYKKILLTKRDMKQNEHLREIF